MKNKFGRNFIAVIIITTLSIGNIFSQEIRNFDLLKNKSFTSASRENTYLNSLYFDNNPALIISKEKTFKTTNDRPLVLEIKASELNLIKEDLKNDFSSIELIKIFHNQEEKPYQLKKNLNELFPNLRAVVFQCDFICNEKDVEGIITDQSKTSVQYYYLTIIPE
jgi:hypothetical protein